MTKPHADAAIRPPYLFLGGLAAGCVLELIAPLGPGLAGGNARAVGIGLGLAVIGFGIAAAAIRRFARAGASIQLDEPTEALVTDGLYAVSRNPIYIGLITAYAGLAIALTTGWALLLLPVLVAMLRRGVVLREEAYLEEAFGEAYRAYRNKVPRWL